MAESVADPRRRVVQEGLLSKSLTAIAKIIQWLLLSLLFSILIEWAGMVLWWPDECAVVARGPGPAAPADRLRNTACTHATD